MEQRTDVDLRTDMDPRAKFRRLPARITQDEMVPVQPVVQAVSRPAVGSEEEYQLRAGGAG
ncbi:hypothetical protein [Jidongwangia harbinensis]|uniref:hypothetical protein n=1 Tax=Jidongwangia harbinensis TaxID=2878561 RepID=UPI001CD9AD6E|nr:hypothetical protein [Jidongwangia harbinensis]MCA2215009.1 hypothetical protein [Jidongwangia harbinensis]